MEKMVRNKQVVLVSYANEGPVTGDHVKIRETQLNLNGCKEGEVVVQNLWASVDPYLRWRMKEDTNRGLYFDNFKLGQPIANVMVGKVVVSAHAGFEVGDLVTGLYDVSEYSIIAGSMLIKLDPNLAQPSDYLGPLGMVGMTAWGGLLLVGEPKAGEQVFVSAAVGVVGLLVGH